MSEHFETRCFSRINTYKIDTGIPVEFFEYYLPLTVSICPHFVFITASIWFDIYF